MATKKRTLQPFSWEQLSEGFVLFQVQNGDGVYVAIGDAEPDNVDAAFVVTDVFSYTGSEKVFVRPITAEEVVVVFDDLKP